MHGNSQVVDLANQPSGSMPYRHEEALCALLRHCVAHPLVATRLPSIRADEISPKNALQILSQVAPAASEDHSQAILRQGAYADIASQSKAGIVFSTSGTTGRPKLLINDYDEMLVNADFHGAAYRAAGICHSDVVATFGGTGTFASEYCVYHALAKTGCITLPINDYRNTLENIELLERLKASVLLAMPSELFDIVEELERNRCRLSEVRLVVTGGEPLSAQLMERLISTMAPHVEFGSTFQSADLGTIGYQCSSCAPRQYHIQEGLHYAEILSQECSEPATEGDLVITNLLRRRMPILRLFSGDRVKLDASEKNPCRCGDNSKKVTLLGRSSDLIKIGGFKIDVGIFTNLAATSGLVESDLAVVISSSPKTGKDQITVQTRTPLSEGKLADIERSIFQDAVLLKMIQAARIEPLEFGSLEPRFDRKSQNKHRKVYDLRRPLLPEAWK